MTSENPKNKIVIGFVGLPGSGKSTALEAVKNMGKIVTMGDVVREEAKRRNIPIFHDTLGKIARELREKYGPKVIAKKCVEFIEKTNESIIFIDGLRSMYEVETFRQKWKFPIIAIICPDELRYKRLIERKRDDDSLNLEQIKARDKRELEFGLKKVIDSADYIINNDSDIDSLKLKTLQIVDSIIKGFKKK
ncbi:MAG: AAA family ATPase [Promethearchaeota archaeon]